MRSESLVAKVRRLEVENGRLATEIDRLKRALAERSLGFPREWRLTHSEAVMMRVLIDRAVATTDALMIALYGNGVGLRRPQVTVVFIGRLRKKLTLFGVHIRAVRRIGYMLDAPTRARLNGREFTN